MQESAAGSGCFYLCRFLSHDGARVLAAGIVASDPSFALGRFVNRHAPALGLGQIEVFDERGRTLLARSWIPASS
jgi:hypothetical protein